MKNLLFLSFLLVACNTSKNSTSNNSISGNGNSTEQIFMAGPGGLPGKCYAKMILDNETRFTEIICRPQITKKLIKQIQSDLVRLKYQIDSDEIEKGNLGSTTKNAIKSFQQKQNMAYGNLDWATVNRLNIAS